MGSGEPVVLLHSYMSDLRKAWVRRGVVQRLAHTEGGGIEAVIRIGSVDVVVTERRKAFTTKADFAALTLNPREYKIVVVKLGYLFPELLEIAPAALMALSPGASDLALVAALLLMGGKLLKLY